MLIAKSEGSGKAKIIGLSVELNNKYKTKSHKVNGGIADNLQWLIDRIRYLLVQIDPKLRLSDL